MKFKTVRFDHNQSLDTLLEIISDMYRIKVSSALLAVADIETVPLDSFLTRPEIVARDVETRALYIYTIKDGTLIKHEHTHCEEVVIAIDRLHIRGIKEHERNQKDPRLSPTFRWTARRIFNGIRNGTLFNKL